MREYTVTLWFGNEWWDTRVMASDAIVAAEKALMEFIHTRGYTLHGSELSRVSISERK